MITEHAARKGCLPHTHDDVCMFFYIAKNEQRQHFQQTNLPNDAALQATTTLMKSRSARGFFFQSLQCCCMFTCIQVVLQCIGPLPPENTRLICLAFIFCSWISEVTPPSLFTCARRLSEEVWVGDMSISNYGQRLLMLEYVEVSACFKI